MSSNSGVRDENGAQAGRDAYQVGNAHGGVDQQQHLDQQRQTVEADELLAGELAGAARELSRAEQERIGEPLALRARWHAAEKDLFDRWQNTDHGTEHDDPVPLQGQFATIRETFRTAEPQRLLVLGRAGAGKTVLAHQVILDLLDHRDQRGPVPVLFSLGDWNPTAIGLRDWMIDRLVRDHPFLEARDDTGKRGAEVLTDRGWILPVLDGFDEISEHRRSDAISAIGQVQLPWLMTSRPDEYARTARTVDAVGHAAVIEIDDLALDQAEEDVCRNAGTSRAAEWAAVFEQLRTAPEQAASQNLIPVLTTPSMLALARARYERADERAPGELLDTVRFPTSAALERHLLDSYLDAVYDPRRIAHPSGAARPNWDANQAHRWLGYLASRLKARDTNDFAWWQLPAFLAPPIRLLANIAVFGFVGWFVGGLAYGFGYGFTTGLLDGLMFGCALGLAVGVVSGIFKEVGFARGRTGRAPERLRLHRRRDRGRAKRSSPRRTASEFLDGLVLGSGFGLTIGTVFGIVLGLAFAARGAVTGGLMVLGVLAGGPAIGLAAGLALGVVLGSVNIVVGLLGKGLDSHDSDPWQLVATDRTATLARAIPAGLLAAVIYSLVMAAGFSEAPLMNGITSGIVLGTLVGLLRWTLSAWGNWLLFARLWLPLTGRLPWRPRRFLEDAYDRGILRRAGAAYQFRHAQLRDHLADPHRKHTKG